MKLSTDPRFILSDDEYKAARSNRENLHKYLDEAFGLGCDYGPNGSSNGAGDSSGLPNISTLKVRSWDEIKSTKPTNPIEILRLQHMPNNPQAAANFETSLMNSLIYAARNFSG